MQCLLVMSAHVNTRNYLLSLYWYVIEAIGGNTSECVKPVGLIPL